MSVSEHFDVQGQRLLDRVAHYFSAEARAKRAVYRQTVAELDSLSARELAELGLSRHDIHDVARKHAGLE